MVNGSPPNMSSGGSKPKTKSKKRNLSSKNIESNGMKRSSFIVLTSLILVSVFFLGIVIFVVSKELARLETENYFYKNGLIKCVIVNGPVKDQDSIIKNQNKNSDTLKKGDKWEY